MREVDQSRGPDSGWVSRLHHPRFTSSDGVRSYFNSILESTPDTVEDVIVEADGEWHTSDDRYASDGWRKTHKPALPLASPTPYPNHQATAHSPSAYIRSASTQEISQNSGDVVVLDSEEEDEGEVKRELSPSRPGQYSMNGLPGMQVIDLTAESDEENTTSRTLGVKRKAEADSASSPEEDIWKKSRIGEQPNTSTVTRSVNGNVNISTSGVFVSGSNRGARQYAMNSAPLQHRPPSTQFTPVTHVESSYTTSYYPQLSRVAAASSGPFGHQASHRAGYYSQYGNG
jgi:E3 SUMO-protein ligase PIAS1